MNDVAIQVENLAKQYRLGVVGTGTLTHDLNRWWHQIRGKEDPYLQIGETNDRTKVGGSQYVWALKDINFEVKQGDVLGIIGKNGAGKSTLLKLLSRVIAPTTGEIRLKGRVASLLEVGTGFHPELTGRENIFLNAAILGMNKAETRAKLDEIIDFSGTARYIDTPVKRYSSGMRVRLAFAVAAFLEPEILIVDEVLAVGDAEFQKKAIGKMQDVAKGGGRTVLFVSHNMQSIQSLCTRGIVLENGMVKYESQIEGAIQYYLQTDNYNYSRDLTNIKDRSGDGRIKIISWNSYIDEEGSSPQLGISGRTFNIKFEYIATQNVDNVIFSVGFNTQDRSFLSACRSDSIGRSYNIVKGEGSVILSFDKLPFNAGEYILTIICHQNNIPIDWIKEAVKIGVESGDYYETGVIPAKNKSGVFLKYDWN